MKHSRAGRKTLTQRRNKAIKEEFKKLSEIKYQGISKYSYDYMLTKLSEKFYLSEKRIHEIIKT